MVHHKKRSKRHFDIILLATGLAFSALAFHIAASSLPESLDRAGIFSSPPEETSEAIPPKPKHVSTPEAVKAIYMTSWVASTKDWRESLAQFIRDTELNSIIIDVKDYSGHVFFDTEDPLVKSIGSEEIRVPDMKDFVEYLHDSNIYVIARITVFQDPVYAKKFPDEAVQQKNGKIWKDRKGLSFIDPGSQDFWKYIVAVARSSEKVGFDELNFDYVRFPSDGDMRNIAFPISGEKKKPEALESFFIYLQSELRSSGVPISADVFGMTTTNTDDLNIGQVLEKIVPYFDYVAPMVYPSHYPAGFHGYKSPASHPYEVVNFAMAKGVERMVAASTTPQKLRPWLQDFDLGADYTSDMIRAEKKAVYDAGLTSWMIWDPSNKYTKGAYDLTPIGANIQ
ncbi:hypothetical protein HYT01_03075 [Candidatus Giovannonibacteria bacterium]|nr:hypothetical protein [Candidatus Giovannonibacteria bacterium]